MGFSSSLQGEAAHEALISRQDAELRLLDNMKRCLSLRVKCDREYAIALNTVVLQVCIVTMYCVYLVCHPNIILRNLYLYWYSSALSPDKEILTTLVNAMDTWSLVIGWSVTH